MKYSCPVCERNLIITPANVVTVKFVSVSVCDGAEHQSMPMFVLFVSQECQEE